MIVGEAWSAILRLLSAALGERERRDCSVGVILDGESDRICIEEDARGF